MDEVLTGVTELSTCWAACDFKPNCAYFVFYLAEETCNLYSTSITGYYQCDIVRGPSGQSYDDEVSFSKLLLVSNQFFFCFRDVVVGMVLLMNQLMHLLMHLLMLLPMHQQKVQPNSHRHNFEIDCFLDM